MPRVTRVAANPDRHEGYAWTPAEFMDQLPGSGWVVLRGLNRAVLAQWPPSARSHAVIAPTLHEVRGQPPAVRSPPGCSAACC